MAAGKPKLTVNCAEIRASQQGICNAGMGRSRSTSKSLRTLTMGWLANGDRAVDR